ncbi:uncharacterized protein PHALS_11912 [Plasmopara halstedii]|uniref:Uncharacterized protein n=1 Tax=Plasmopara halstedii TaxID=4781 RepID=A0A0P1AKV3_PLAHL|nr:uncharacterized protein PHALS_11912 [Plasmopara halstedii]CEG41575.1 hypothetical protein PHALS_11912 [Plasmopara halstedii]|eukprot:XP_024577944.1 hypothetical protein PHALS_11912 [Plasmopara halstedii]
MGKYQTQETSVEQEFAKLAVQLVQTADDTIRCLKSLYRNLAKFDSCHGLRFRRKSKKFMRSDIRVVKDLTIDLRYVAKRIRRNKSPTRSEINAARISMNAIAGALNDLKQAGRVFDQNNSLSGDTSGRSVDNLADSDDEKSVEDNEKLFGCRANEKLKVKSKSDGYSLESTDMVESVVRLTLHDSFNGFHALKQQIRATESAISPSIATRAKNAVVDAVSRVIGTPCDDNQNEHT